MKNNKGFSLVELIIVIAIMAILVGVMAPQLIKYIEKTNVSSDVQLCDSVRTAIMTAALDPDCVKAGEVLNSGTGQTITGAVPGTSMQSCIVETLGCPIASVDGKIKSKVGKAAGSVLVDVVNSNTITVYIDKSAGIQSGD